jgi:predicted nucleic acid-binding protein
MSACRSSGTDIPCFAFPQVHGQARCEIAFMRTRLTAEEREELLDIVLAVCEWTPIYFGWRPNLRDEGDNHLVELAVAGGACLIVTRNLRDFSRMKLRFSSLRAVSPEDFLKELQT